MKRTKKVRKEALTLSFGNFTSNWLENYEL